MSVKTRGFASMTPERKKEVASKGGKAVHQKGVGYKWTPEEAKIAGRKGGMESRRKKNEAKISKGIDPK